MSRYVKRFLGLGVIIVAVACGGSQAAPQTSTAGATKSPIGGACTSDAACETGLFCDTGDPGGQCLKKCSTTADCGSGGRCAVMRRSATTRVKARRIARAPDTRAWAKHLRCFATWPKRNTRSHRGDRARIAAERGGRPDAVYALFPLRGSEKEGKANESLANRLLDRRNWLRTSARIGVCGASGTSSSCTQHPTAAFSRDYANGWPASYDDGTNPANDRADERTGRLVTSDRRGRRGVGYGS
jgi:hypothetical protein